MVLATAWQLLLPPLAAAPTRQPSGSHLPLFSAKTNTATPGVRQSSPHGPSHTKTPFMPIPSQKPGGLPYAAPLHLCPEVREPVGRGASTQGSNGSNDRQHHIVQQLLHSRVELWQLAGAGLHAPTLNCSGRPQGRQEGVTHGEEQATTPQCSALDAISLTDQDES